MRALLAALIVFVSALALSAPAEARGHHRGWTHIHLHRVAHARHHVRFSHHLRVRHYAAQRDINEAQNWQPRAWSEGGEREVPWSGYARDNQTIASGDRYGQVLPHPAGCPRIAFCGCGVAERVFGSPVRALWLAANWLSFPRTQAAPGMVAVFGHHHVAYIEAIHGDGTATVYDPNSGRHLTRVHRRSIAGATIVDPHGGHRHYAGI